MKKLVSAMLMLAAIAGTAVAQQVQEHLLPPLPYSTVTADVLPTHTSFCIYGYSRQSTQLPIADHEISVAIPFVVLAPGSLSTVCVLLPDTALGYYEGFSDNYDVFSLSPAVTSSDSFFIAWSKMKYFGSDVPGTSYTLPNAWLGKIEGGSIAQTVHFMNGLHPSVVVDRADALHVVWENVAPIPSSRTSFFNLYGSTIVYRKRASTGQWSDSTIIGKGFLPRLLRNQDIIHCLYFRADSSTQTDYSMVLQRMNAGVLEPLVTLWEFHAPTEAVRYPYLDHSPFAEFNWGVDAAGGVHVAWSSWYSPSKVCILHYHDGLGVQIDSTGAYYLNTPAFEFTNDGEVHLIALTQDSSSARAVLRYIVSKQGSAMRDVHDILLPSNSMGLQQAFVDHSGNEYAIVMDYAGSSKTYILKDLAESDTTLYSLGNKYTFEASSFVDNAGSVWLTGVRDSTCVLLSFSLSGIGSVGGTRSVIPGSFTLSQNYPNPFNPATTIRFSVPSAQFVSVTVWDLLGREVARLVDRRLTAGEYSCAWDAERFPSGVYLCRLNVGGTQMMRKMILLK